MGLAKHLADKQKSSVIDPGTKNKPNPTTTSSTSTAGPNLTKAKGIFSQKDVPLWAGPQSDADNGGITFSLLNRFLQCRERFRILVTKGLKAEDGFNHRLGYGNMWHVCEEALASERSHFGEVVGTTLWQDNLRSYTEQLCRQYRSAQAQIVHWYEVCKRQFPLYVDYWAKHPDVKGRTPLLEEVSFKVPYALPSGRVVYLRGKWDSVDRVDGKVWVQENKTKGDVRPDLLKRQLTFDLQTMIYVVALQNYTRLHISGIGRDEGEIARWWSAPISGVRYNVIRRPLSGGKGNIKPKKGKPSVKLKSGKMSKAIIAETMEHYYERMADYIRKEPETYFLRFNVKVKPDDVERFKHHCLDPILEQLCNWWEQVSAPQNASDPFEDSLCGDGRAFPNSLHWRTPFGLRPLEENMSTELDYFLETGISVGLERTTNLFPELS